MHKIKTIFHEKLEKMKELPNHKYSLTEIENMIPWERDVYISRLVNYIKEENEKERKRQEK